MSNEKRKAEMLDKMLIYLFEKYSFDEGDCSFEKTWF